MPPTSVHHQAADVFGRALAAAEDDAVMARLDPGQNAIVHLTEAARAAFMQLLAPLVEAQRVRFGDDLFRHLTI